MKIKYLFFIRNIRLVKFCALGKQDPSSNWRSRFLCGLPMHILKTSVERFLYIKNIFDKLIFKTRELKKKGMNISPRPGICSLCLLFRSVHLAKSFFSPEQIACYIGSVEKKLTAKKKRFNLVTGQNAPIFYRNDRTFFSRINIILPKRPFFLSKRHV